MTKATVRRSPHGTWVMLWPGGYAYDFWTDADSARRAAERAAELLTENLGREHVDDLLRRQGFLRQARIRESAGSD